MDDGPQTAKYSFRGTTEERTGLDKVLGGGLNRGTMEEQFGEQREENGEQGSKASGNKGPGNRVDRGRGMEKRERRVESSK